MDSGRLERDDADWNFRARHETETQRLDRNWNGLLQELRVVQTGVQLLTGFLLTLPFQERFGELTDAEVLIYLVTVALSVTSTMLLVAPVGIHRMLFRLHALYDLVAVAHRLAICGITTLAMALIGVVLLIFSFVVSPVVGVVAAAVAVALFLGLWLFARILQGRHRK
ncbi:DUF6328 family protein [Rhodococcus oxybenzonivorans]|jgi:hypothetical protein|uniref:Sodium:proton antiporter n=1 Tax=Rhodococcus oxybenzonivorans TaxID=1990687 RepID=A0A2S2BVP4_9NOCA|nr:MULTISPECIES: DUF6328 family protein [Rhodococcus]AWK72634.1 hypothetical protein CBI38_14725 [Rhodococcus oxybenzonivorans]MDV7351667.1 DUF6328 family protein [Rhodococcus oxybenzonivorans]QHE69547.1 Integral membrane protein [Rhodococcus sp. WAY2]